MAQTDHYRETLRFATTGFVGRAELEAAPILSRRDLDGAGDAIRSELATYAFSSYSSGTTESPVIIDRSAEEQNYLTEFFNLLNRDDVAIPRLALLAASWHHGRRLELPGNICVLAVSLAARTGYDIAHRLLSRQFRTGGPTHIAVIAGATNRIEQLTRYLQLRESDGFPDIDELHVSGQYLSERSKTYLEEYWRAPVHDTYSLTELFGSAFRCIECGLYHFHPFIFPEAVDLVSGQRISKGRGRLLLTGLYPFTQMTPIIRYSPGDVVEVSPIVCSIGRPGFQFLGRVARALILQSGKGPNWILTGADVIEAVGTINEVAIFRDPAPIPEECQGVGAPKFGVLPSIPETLAIELTFDPKVEPERTNRIGQLIRDRLAANAPQAAQPSLRALKLRLVPPGTLDAISVSRP